jgi:YfiH family protein
MPRVFLIEASPIGRIVIPQTLPPATALFYTTRDFGGRIRHDIAGELTTLVHARFGIETSLATCNQVHGATVHKVEPESGWRECDSCDALWTAARGAALGIKVADCLPVTLIDPESRVIANVHSGWRGGVQKITGVTVDKVMKASPFDPKRAYAYLGPSIRSCCFEVGEEVVDKFRAAYPDAASFIDRSRPKAHIDLPGITRKVLLDRGFAAERIFDSELCTRCEGSIFHSFRRDGAGGGRNLAIVAQ